MRFVAGTAWEVELGGARAEAIRRRFRVSAALLSGLWVPLMLFGDPRIFGSTRAGLWARLPTLAVVLGAAFYLRKPRARWTTEIVAAGALGFVWLVWARVVVVSVEDSYVPAMLSIVLATSITAIALLLSWQTTAIYCFVSNAGQLAAGFVRGAPSIYFYLVVTGFIAWPLLVFAAASRDRSQRAEAKARAELRAANEQLHREQQARSRLFVNLSHDFRTPLAVVRSAAELLRRRGGDEQARATLDLIESNAASVVELIDQLLELARLDAARTPVTPRACDLVAAAREVAAKLQPAAGGARVTVVAPEGRPSAHVDPAHLRRILQNLVANALLQVSERGGEVRVRFGAGAAGPIVDVVDDGPGIPPELRGQLFERFASFRPEGGTASGIGLALARELAELNGGSLVLVADAPATTFRLTLAPGAPVLEEAAPLAPARAPLLPATALEPAAAASRPSVLLVDDNDDLRATLAQVLAPRFEIETAASVAAARQALSRSVPAAIVSDVMLPDGSGYEILAGVRGGRRFDRVPVILLTALGETDERVRGLAAGADDYVVKPFAGAELAARITAAIERAVERSAAIDRQREDLLLELHDGVCGSLSRAVVGLERLAGRPGADGDGALSRAIDAVREGLTEARSLLTALGSTAETWDVFVAQLRWESASACERADVALEFDARAEGAGVACISAAAGHALRRIASEAITNAVRHAAPRKVRLVLSGGARELRVRVEDDGRGGDAAPGRGLSGVRRRARRFGGDATFGGGPTGGFVVEAWLRPEA
jgi:signal transduction histidine kinase